VKLLRCKTSDKLPPTIHKEEEDCCQQLFSCITTLFASCCGHNNTDNSKPQVRVPATKPYISDPAYSHFHALRLLQEAIHGRQFGSDEEVKEAVHTWVREQSKAFFPFGIRKLADRYKKCVELDSD